MTGKVRVACVGAGYFSRFHYGSWARMKDVELLASCNRSIEKARATGLPAYDDLDLMLSEKRPDLLDIILPPAAHAATIRKAISYGIRVLICQKPFCQNLKEAQQIADEAEASGTIVVVHENFRFQPWYRIDQAIAAGRPRRQVTASDLPLAPGRRSGAARLSGPATLFSGDAAVSRARNSGALDRHVSLPAWRSNCRLRRSETGKSCYRRRGRGVHPVRLSERGTRAL